MAFTTYYALKSETNLPLNTYFVDPYSGDKYYPQPSETLDSFMERISTSLKEKDYPSYFPHEFKSMVVTSLVESADQRTTEQYFTQQAIPPTLRELVTLGRTILAQMIHADHASFKVRQERALVCLSNACSMHKQKSKISQAALKLINKVLSIDTLSTSENEAALGTCSMCGCGLTAKNKLSLMNILAGLLPGDLAKLTTRHKERAFDRCWILRECLENPNSRRILEGKLKKAPNDQSHFLHIYEQQKDLQD